MAEPTGWITVNGNHVPLYAGESKADAVKRFTEGKKNEAVKGGGNTEYKKGDKAYYRDYAGNVYEGTVSGTVTTKSGQTKILVKDKDGDTHTTSLEEQKQFAKKGVKKDTKAENKTAKSNTPSTSQGSTVSTPYGVFHKKGNRWVTKDGQSWSNDQMEKWLDR